MALLVLIVIAVGFYLVLKNQGLEIQLKKMERRLLDLEDNLRRLHTKIVTQLPGFLEGGMVKSATVVPETKVEPVKPPKIEKVPSTVSCRTCWAPLEPGSDYCDQCGTRVKAVPAVSPTPAPTPLPVFSDFPEPKKKVAPLSRTTPAAVKSEPFKMPSIDWEKFMGVKLFAWLGGFALFLGMAFFVKYSLDHNLISPLLRVTIGFLIGVGTIIGGLTMRKKGYDVTVHTLCAAGISVLYADTFACRSFYNFLSPEVAFGLMIIITITSFLLAVRLDSRYVAILGLVGGFLTPPLMSTGVDHPIALFSYILLLDMGLAAVTIRQRWGFLLGLSSAATFLMEVGWTLKFFSPEKAWLAMGIYLTFGIFFVIVSSIADQQGAKDNAFQEPADFMPLLSLGFAGYLLSFKELGAHPGVIFTLIFSNLALMGWRATRRATSQSPYSLGVAAGFILLSVWTVRYMTPNLAMLTAGLYLILCAFTFFVSSVADRRETGSAAVNGAADYMPLAAFGLVAYFLTLPTLGEHPFLIFSMIFALGGILAARAIFGKGSRVAYGLGVMAGLCLIASWTFSFMTPAGVFTATAVILGFCVFHLEVSRMSEKKGIQDENVHSPADYLPLASMGFVAYMLHFPTLGHRPGIVLSVLLILGGMLAYRALKRPEARFAYGLGGAASFFILTFWTVHYMRSSLLLWGLGYFMAFAVLHTMFPILWQRLRPSVKPLLAGFVAPMMGLVLILVAMLACDLLTFLLWPFVLLLGMLGVALAWLAGSLLAAGGTIVLVMACFAVWLFRLPDAAGLSGVLTLLAVFSCAFFAWSLLVTRGKSLFSGNAFLSQAGSISADEAAEFPAYTAVMPFMLMMMVCVRLPLPNPTDIFLLALLLDVLLLALVRYRKMPLLVPVALGSTVMLELTWLSRNTPLAQPMGPLGWALVFYALFMFFPFLFRRHLRGMAPWMCSALAGVVQWPLVWEAVHQTLGGPSMALVPAFFALPSLACLIGVLSQEKDEWRVSKLAWFGGITLLFITLIIPIQFDKEWLTVGWALEGAALLWLRRRVPHEGLKGWGLALLAIAFVRLAVNPSVLSYHPRTGDPIFNWYLWVYGMAIASYYLGAYFMRASREFLETDMPPLLNSAGTILAFLLVNIEIADYFSTGSVITFNFSGNLAQDMAYSLSWALFAILLLIAGIRQTSKGARYASLALLMVTILKVFLHDLWRLGQLFRVASFVGLAVILILVSFLYQKFLGDEPKVGGAS